MKSNKLSKEQQIQESQYGFPYHYLDLGSEEFKYIWNVEAVAKIELVKNILIKARVDNLLDAGCGDGRLAYELRNTKIVYTGVDYSLAAIRFAKAFNPDQIFLQADLSKMKLKKSYDAVVLIETLEHVPVNQVPRVIANLKKHLRKNGTLIITVPSNNLVLQDKHFQHFSSDALKNILELSFSSVRIMGFYSIGWKKSLFLGLRTLCLAFYPFRTRLKITNSLFVLYKNFFIKHLSDADSNKSLSLIAICKK
jgi:2-polyprenyl-3-methyl-5-hydroxy-6-metoxy-1,4-benzoquinol methylase